MKKVLFIYPSMMVGGSTTSLLSILNEFDYKKYSVDLLLLSQKGKMFDFLPEEVRVLPFAIPNTSRRKIKIKKAFSIKSVINLVRGKYYDKRVGNSNVRSQIMQKDTLRFCTELHEDYDVAISFLEGWPLYYVAEKVSAKKKIAWIHLDYIESKLKPDFDRSALGVVDKIVLVSNICKEHFDNVFPEYAAKSCVVENILSRKYILQRSDEKIDFNLPKLREKKIKFITVCRIVFYHKGLDRAIKALAEMKRERGIPSEFGWYIVGNGQDFSKMTALIEENELEDFIFACGETINPLPIVKQCDIFFLPSRYEGKPMAVTEAQMLGLLPIVTEYSSASEQIVDGENGYIIDNNDNSLKQFLYDLLQGKIDWESRKNKVSLYEYSNIEAFDKVLKLIEE